MSNHLQQNKVAYLVANGGEVQDSAIVVKKENGDIAVVDSFSKVLWIRAEKETERCKETPDLFGGDE